ncbi:hypothetical protein HX13_20655 [Chryseobacterium sp. P1-3]|uniref:hypothetical protein n=1 Tax=Chryseobacterium TaxID=59732 RepID=UPI0004E6727F|nr:MULTISPECIES: hypothetical protein [Chryseobacterium]KFF73418.1 hypothetical protein HX13_20655 [Chryseobacterium sp. P1-3]MCL8536328.1 hypothetical protein [Chryseobacterium gallinarum]
MKTEIIEIVQRIKNKHVNDPTVSEDKDQIVEVLLSDVKEAIKTISTLDEDTLEWISSRFEDLSYKLQSKEFIDCLKNLLLKFPNNMTLKEDVEDAIEAYYGNV